MNKFDTSHLSNLNLKNNYYDSIGISYLKDCDLSRLVTLNLSYNKLFDDGIKSLKLLNLYNIKQLHLEKNYLKPNSIKYINNYMNLKFLEILNLNSNFIGNEGLLNLKDYKGKNLKELYLNDNEIGDIYIHEFVNNYFLSNLTILELNYNEISNDGMYKFVNSSFNKLKKLSLKYNKSDSNGLVNFISSVKYKFDLEISGSINMPYNEVKNIGIKYGFNVY